MSLEAYGDGDVPEPCEQCLKLDDLVDAVQKISATGVYEGGKKENGISVALIGAITEALRIAEDR